MTSVCHQAARSCWLSMASTSGTPSTAGSTGWASVKAAKRAPVGQDEPVSQLGNHHGAERRRNFSPWYAWMASLLSTVHADPMPVEGGEALRPWLERCRMRLHELLGPMPDPVPLRLEALETTECSTYRRTKVVYDTEDVMSVPAYLLEPRERSAPGPAVLAVHGHGPGKSVVCGIEDSGTPGGDYAHQLASAGFVVLAPDLRCFGERADWNPPDHYACDTNLVHALMAGCNPLAQNLWDLMRSVDVLALHPLVDASRIGVVGFSYGGTMALFLGACDQRVAAVVMSGFLSEWKEAHKVPWNMCGSQVLPGMLGRLEHVDVAALIAPRPLLVESGTEDLLFPVASARKTVAQLTRVYEHFGAGDRIVHDVFEGGHRWYGAAVSRFLERWL